LANKAAIINADVPTQFKAMGLIACIAQEQKVEMTRRISPTGLSLIQLELLHALDQAPEKSLTVNELKQVMIDDSPNVSRALNKLMEAGFIIKQRSEADQRVVHICITEAGSAAHQQADRALMDMKLGLSDAETEQLFQLLAKL